MSEEDLDLGLQSTPALADADVGMRKRRKKHRYIDEEFSDWDLKMIKLKGLTLDQARKVRAAGRAWYEAFSKRVAEKYGLEVKQRGDHPNRSAH